MLQSWKTFRYFTLSFKILFFKENFNFELITLLTFALEASTDLFERHNT